MPNWLSRYLHNDWTYKEIKTKNINDVSHKTLLNTIRVCFNWVKGFMKKFQGKRG